MTINPQSVVWYYGTEEQKEELLQILNDNCKKINSRPGSWAFFF